MKEFILANEKPKYNENQAQIHNCVLASFLKFLVLFKYIEPSKEIMKLLFQILDVLNHLKVFCLIIYLFYLE